MNLVCKMIESPIGKLKLVASDEGLVAVLWEKDSPRRVRLSELTEEEPHPVPVETERQLGKYFDGKRKEFSIALDMRGTRFQKDVWEALLAIPFGQTRSYRQLAKQLGIFRRPELSAQRMEEIRCQSSSLATPHRIVWKTYGLCVRTLYDSPSAQPGGRRATSLPGSELFGRKRQQICTAATDWFGAEHDERT